MKTCGEGHSYDRDRYHRCPSCGVPGLTLDPDPEATTRVVDPVEDDATTRVADPVQDDATTRVADPVQDDATILVVEDSATRVFPPRVEPFDPVVAWLVVARGPARGRDTAIRAAGAEVRLDRAGQVTVGPKGAGVGAGESDALATVSFHVDDDGSAYRLVSRRGSDVRLNGDPAPPTAVLDAFDVIGVGSTELVFVPLCGDRFQWSGLEADVPVAAP